MKEEFSDYCLLYLEFLAKYLKVDVNISMLYTTGLIHEGLHFRPRPKLQIIQTRVSIDNKNYFIFPLMTEIPS